MAERSNARLYGRAGFLATHVDVVDEHADRVAVNVCGWADSAYGQAS
jgi:hypothetical protein